jgi:Fe2+ transport system protein FeoA
VATLDQIPAGARAVVTGFSADAPPRLMEMGLLPGTTVEVVRLAPLGDPMDLRVRGFHLSIRRAEAAAVRVDRL